MNSKKCYKFYTKPKKNQSTFAPNRPRYAAD